MNVVRTAPPGSDLDPSLVVSMPYLYAISGLTLATPARLLGVRAAAAGTIPDIVFTIDPGPPAADQLPGESPLFRDTEMEQGRPALRVWRRGTDGAYRFLYADGTQFVVAEDGRHVQGCWPTSLTIDDAATYLLGPIIGFLLRLRGIPCLHASAVALGSRAVAFVGPPGAGKSTLAAALAQRGAFVLADDTVTLRQESEEGPFLVEPSYAHLRLWSDSATYLLGADQPLPLLAPSWEKGYLDLSTRGIPQADRPLPLAALYLLQPRSAGAEAPAILPALAGQLTLLDLIVNTYTNYVLATEMRAHEFRVLSRLVSRVPVRRLVSSTDPAKLPELCALVRQDFAEQGAEI